MVIFVAKEKTEKKEEQTKKTEKNKETETKPEEKEKTEKQKETKKEPQENKETKRKKKKTKKSKKYGIMVKAKKKNAVARAVIKTGKGKITINQKNPKIIEPEYLKEMIFEPIKLAGDAIKETDIKVNVIGGGFMGQAIAARGAIGKAIIEYTNDKKLKEKFINYDRLLLVDDHRRVEPKKPLGKKARKKKQSSKR